MMSSRPDYRAIIPSPMPGAYCLGLFFNPQGLSGIDLLSAESLCFVEAAPDVQQAVTALHEYFACPSRSISLPPLAPQGTVFQQRVWQALLVIPCGQSLRYGELARQLGSGARAIAAACKANPIPLLIPCHRVVAANGLGGYMGQTQGEGIAIKRWLLEHEQDAG